MSLPGVVFLAAFTARSQAYAQALHAAGMAPRHVVQFGKDRQAAGAPGLIEGDQRSVDGIGLPDLGEPLRTTCEKAGWPVTALEEDHVNDPRITATLQELEPDLVIYSGYGGQLVAPEVLRAGAPFLHMHAGWLPDFRGSTTVYYSWLMEKRCGVSALLLEPEIDEGPIVGRRHYPLPPSGVDVDQVYDSAIRADLLVRTLRDYAGSGSFASITQDDGTGNIFYVIHPVLKHIALLSREND